MNVGNNIKKIRKAKGLTQADLGRKLGISQAAIGQFEKGKTSIKIETIEKISKALDVPVNSLLLGLDIDPNESSENKDKTNSETTKRLAIIKFLECIYNFACINKVKIYDRKTGNEIYNEEYISIADNYGCGAGVIDNDVLDTAINIIESICKNLIHLNSMSEDAYIEQFFPNANKNLYFSFYEERVEIAITSKLRDDELRPSEKKDISKDVLLEIEENANQEEFVSIDVNKNPPAT